MRRFVCTTILLTLSISLRGVMGQMNFFASGGDVAFSNNISESCLAAMNTTLKCPSQFTSYPNSDYAGPFSKTELDGFCSPTCVASLRDYRSGVASKCSKDPTIFNDIPTSFLGDRMAAYQNRTCLKDERGGNYCNSKSYALIAAQRKSVLIKCSVVNANWTQSLPNHDIAFNMLPKANLCSICFLGLLRAIESTPYSNYDESFVTPYQDAQKGQL